MKRKTAVTLDAAIRVMRKGREYTSSDLARLMDAPSSSVRHVLASDRAITRLDVRSSERGRLFSLIGTCRHSSRHVDTRVRPDLTATLAGYQRALTTQRELAETIRR
jgi:hypothetical protein